MSFETEHAKGECDAYRLAIAAEFDGEPAELPEADVKAHIAECRACDEYRADLLMLRDDFVGLPELSMPDDALAAVFARTVDAPAPARVHRWGRAIRIATFASAAAVVLALGLPQRFAAQTQPASAAEVERATAQTLFVLGLASDAIERAERVTVEDVLDGRITPALRHVSDEWFRISIPTLRRLGT